jgi:hypothetical protein
VPIASQTRILKKTRTVFARSKAGIVGSNPTRGMDLCVRLFCVCVVLCTGREALRRADRLSKESYRLCKKDYETEEERERPNKRAAEPLKNE